MAAHNPDAPKPGIFARIFGTKRPPPPIANRSHADREAAVVRAEADADAVIAKLRQEQADAMSRAIMTREKAVRDAKARKVAEHDEVSRAIASEMRDEFTRIATRWAAGDPAAAVELSEAIVSFDARIEHEIGKIRIVSRFSRVGVVGYAVDRALATAHGMGDRCVPPTQKGIAGGAEWNAHTARLREARAVFFDFARKHTHEAILVEALRAYALALIAKLHDRPEDPELRIASELHACDRLAERHINEFVEARRAGEALERRRASARAWLGIDHSEDIKKASHKYRPELVERIERRRREAHEILGDHDGETEIDPSAA